MNDIVRRELRIETSRANETERSIDAALSSGEPVSRAFGWEVLSHEPGAIDLARALPRLPLLFNHDTDIPIGSASNVRIENGKLRARLHFARTEKGDEAFSLVRDGHITGVSIGYQLDETQETGQRDGLPIITAKKWSLLEASIVPIPADHQGAGIGRSHSLTMNYRGKTMEKSVETQPREQTLIALGEQYKKYVTIDDVSEAMRAGHSVDHFRETIMQKMESRHTNTAELHIGMTQREVSRYSLAKALKASLTNDWRDAGLEREASEAMARVLGRPAMGFYIPHDVFRRDFNVGTSTEAGNLVATNFRGDLYVDALRENLAFGQLGVRFLTGLTGDVDIPRKTTASTLGMLAEIGSASETNPLTTKHTLSPKRTGAYVEVSKQAIIQSSLALEPLLRDDLLAGAAVLMEYYGINGAGTANQPTGIRNTTGVGTVSEATNGTALIWDHLVDVESVAANGNAEPGSMAGYLINTKTRGKSKKVQKGTNLPFLWDGGAMPLNGYRVGVTNNVPSNLTKGTSTTICSSMLFSSDWSMAVLGLFGAPDVTVDPYSKADSGQVKITLNQFYDFVIRQPGSFVVRNDILTT